MKNKSHTSSVARQGSVSAITKHSFQPQIERAKLLTDIAPFRRPASVGFSYTASCSRSYIASAEKSFKFSLSLRIASGLVTGPAGSNPAFKPTVLPSAGHSPASAPLPSVRCAHVGAAQLQRWAS
jgi:hypothetical protein